MTILTDKQKDHMDVGAGLEGVGEAVDAQLVANKHFIKHSFRLSVDVDTDDTDVQTSKELTLPAGHIFHGALIIGGAPVGTAGGSKTVQVAMGSVAVADGDLGDATDVDILVASGAKTAAFVHGDAASDHVAAYFPMDFHGKHIAADTDIFVNMIGQDDDATANAGTVEVELDVYLFVTKL